MSRLSPRNRFTSSGSSSSSCSRSVSRWSMTSIRHPETLMHHGARSGVLQELFLLRIEMVLDREGGERGLVEPGENQLLLSRVGVDVADGEHPGYAGLKLLGGDPEGLLLKRQPPI